MAYDNIREEELKNKVAADWFADYDTTQIIGNIDFCVALPCHEPEFFETEYLLWAEAKAGTRHDIYASFVQLILTIGRARTFDRHLPPRFLGAFDAEKIAFLPYERIIDVFYVNDFNWNVTPSDHDSREFRQLYDCVSQSLQADATTYRFDRDAHELRQFIRQNFVVKTGTVSKVRISKNNFIHIYQKWHAEVAPHININWEDAKRENLIDADFYLADLLSKDNTSLRDKLFVLLRSDHYIYNIQKRNIGSMRFDRVDFDDKQRAHTAFWNRYERPPRREYWDYIVERRDLLVPQDIRERRGSYFTPQRWVELSQQYLADELGDNWQDEYTVWDCAAGTGNLLNGLTNKYNVWASTLDEQDVRAMRDRIAAGSLNLLDKHVFQFDFLNDDFAKLPEDLRKIIADPERRRKLVVYINPPYAEASDTKTLSGGKGKNAVEQTAINKKYASVLGQGNAELFVQFFTRIYHEIPHCVLAEFSTLKILQGPHFSDFRNFFRAKLGRFFVIPANTFDNVKGDFPIGFMVWDTNGTDVFKTATADVYDRSGQMIEKKTFRAYNDDHYINEWIKKFRGKSKAKSIGKFPFKGNDFQNQRIVQIVHPDMVYNKEAGQFLITRDNLNLACIYFAVRKVIPATWLNDRDQFLAPNDGWIGDEAFITDSLAYTLFTNHIQSQYGTNHWIPFTEAEVDAKEKFQSHFMSDYIRHRRWRPEPENDLFSQHASISAEKQAHDDADPYVPFSPAARAVFDAGRALWRYYHAQPDAQPDAALYDIRLHFQGRNDKGKMNTDSADAEYNRLIADLREALRRLARQIEPKVYEYGFLK